ncbi:MAG: cytochrome c peroxidase [Bacteroidota bacterium]
MKKLLITVTLLTLFTILYLSFRVPQAQASLAQVQHQYRQDVDQLREQTLALQQQARSFDQNSIEQLQETHLKTRLAYKRIEAFINYYDAFAVNKNLNGAPLPKTEPAVAEVFIVEPTGLQVLDELIFSDDPMVEKKEIVKHANKLAGVYQKMAMRQQTIQLEHRHVFEACRQELVRIFTLGVTGFDTPGSVNALPEAAVAMQSVSDAVAAYYPLIISAETDLVSETEVIFENAIQYVEENDDFDSFDRLIFLVDYINPLYEAIYNIHVTTGVEMVDEVNPIPMPFNYEATNLFDTDFLNLKYFSNLDLDHPNAEKRLELGRYLFFDPVLSSTNDRSCASCHQPGKAFTDGEKLSLATGNNGTVTRNSPTLLNAAYAEKFFYDLRGLNLEKQSKHVIFDEKEFDTNFAEILDKLGQSEEYKTLFEEAYSDQPDYTFSAATVTNALAYYTASLQALNSPFDQYVRGESEEMSEEVRLGFNVFMGKGACGTCHFAPTFNGSVPPLYSESESEILGVPETADNKQLDDDIGRIGNHFPRDNAPFYKHSFKTVTVRNIELTAPYMHNGIYENLEQVIDFYNKGGGAGMGLDVPYQTLPDAPLNLTDEEQKALIAFMKSLTDHTATTHFTAPETLPTFDDQASLNQRPIGGSY